MRTAYRGVKFFHFGELASSLLSCVIQFFPMDKYINAISIVCPGGTRIATGEKTLKVRRWEPDLDPADDLLIVENKRFLHKAGEEDETGRPVAIVKVAFVRPFVPSDMKAACANYFEEGWFAWELTQVRPVQSDTTVRATTGIYRIKLAELL